MNIAIGCDHGGFEHKNAIVKFLEEKGHTVKDFGTYTADSVDYPDIAIPLARSVAAGENTLGILVCGTGIGMSLAANKVKGIRAAAVSEAFSAEFTRRHNNSNILCLGGRVISIEKAIELVDLFITTKFEGGRHQKRVDKIMALENE